MKEQYKEINFRGKALATIEQANDIIDEYRSDGLTLTLRQLYYQFVARGLLPNKQTSYDNLGRVISDARLAGLVDWAAIEDRTRFLRGRTNWRNPRQMIEYNARNYTVDMWSNQPYRIEVWIEKDALIGVIDSVCYKYDVDYFACRGYVSQSELYSAGRRIRDRYNQTGQETIVLHLGDHDPSGIDMTRDNEERLCMFAEMFISVERIALNMNQVEVYNPPPNPAKLSDSRARNYIEEYGTSSWELDALEPRMLQSLITNRINMYREENLWAERVAIHERHKEQLNQIIQEL